MRGWDRYLSERDKLVIEQSGYGHTAGLGKRPAFLVVDVTYAFCGPRPQSILDSTQDWHNSCGEEAWQAVDKMAPLIEAARKRNVPVFYSTRQEPGDGAFFEGRWKDKNPRFVTAARPVHRNYIVEPIEPQRTDIVIEKMKPSAFFGTPLASYLVDLGIDSLIVCGVATSGCVRATVVDAFSLNYRIAVIEDCTFDRCEASHWLNLLDMNMKYADVVPSDTIAAYLQTVGTDLYGGQFDGLRGGQMKRVLENA